MSTYTTGELARAAGVTVRTVQYYDTRGILIPSALTEGGRRLYSEDDLRRMKLICFLRELDIPIKSIGELLREEHPENVIGLLLDERERELRAELSARESQLERLTGLRRELKSVGTFSLESIGDMAHIMENKKKMHKLYAILLLTGLPMTVLQWGTILLWILRGIWWPFLVWAVLVIPYGVWMSRYYFKRVAYVCPECRKTFVPTLKDAFFAPHTPKTRKLTCTHCGHHGYCVEVWRDPDAE